MSHEEEQHHEALEESHWTSIGWMPGVSLACWNVLDDDMIHAASNKPTATETLCGEPVWMPEGAFTAKSGVGIPIPWETGAMTPPPALRGGVRTICVTCVEGSMTKHEET